MDNSVIHPAFSRRDFLKVISLGTGALYLSGCANTPIAAIPATAPQGASVISSTTPTPAASTRNAWRIIGPGGGGALYIPTIKPDDADTVLLACDMTGSYRTCDGGTTWQQHSFKVWTGAFAFDPAQPQTVYAGATGLYRSDDAGETWTLVFPDPAHVIKETYLGDHANHAFVSGDNWPGGKVVFIAIDPADSRKLFIVIKQANLLLFGSDNEGRTWTQIDQLPGDQLIGAYGDPVSNRSFFLTPSGLYESSPDTKTLTALPLPVAREFSALGGGVNPAAGKFVLFLTSPGRWQADRFSSGLFRSFDLGRTWEPIGRGLDADLPVKQERHLNRIGVAPHDARIIYLSAVEPADGDSTPFGIFKSEDMGETWQWALRIGEEQPANRVIGWVERDFQPTWGGAPFFLSVAPSNPDVCYATDWGTAYRTIDGGQTWQQLYCDLLPDGSVTTRGLDVTNTYFVSFDPFEADHLALAATDIGAFHSHTGGQSWTHALNGVPAAWTNSCYKIIFDPQVPGRAWAAWSACHDMPRPKMFKTGNFNRYQGGITLSNNGLHSWAKSNRGLPPNCVPTDLILDPKSTPGQRTLYAALVGKGVYKSTDNGQSWIAQNNGLAPNLNAWRLIMLPNGTLYLLVCRGWAADKEIAGALYRSIDGAETWQPIDLPVGVNFPNDLDFDPAQPDRLYLAAWPTQVEQSSIGGGLWRTEDGGAHWRAAFDATAHVYGVAVEAHHPSTVIITTFEGGVHRSDDGGTTWRSLPGFDFKWPKQPIFDPHHPGMLYITTFGGSVWYGAADGA